jgi:hypothetical protein
MKFTYSDNFNRQGQQPPHPTTSTTMEITPHGIHLTYQLLNDANFGGKRTMFIPKSFPLSISLDETYRTQAPYNGEGHYTIFSNNPECMLHPDAYDDIMKHYICIPDVFQGAKILTLSDRIITLWDKGIEVRHTSRFVRKNHEHLNTVSIRTFVPRNGVEMLEGVRKSIKFGSITMDFTNEKEYNKTYMFFLENMIVKPPNQDTQQVTTANLLDL